MKGTQGNINARNTIGRSLIRVVLMRSALLTELTHVTDESGRTPLHLAAVKNDLDAIKNLIANGADLQARDGSGWTPLHLAAANDNVDVINTLLTYGADLQARDDFGWTPLHAAVCCTGSGFVNRHDPSAAVEMLINHGAAIQVRDNFGWTALHTAAWHDRSAAVEILINHGAAIQARADNGLTPLHVASVAGGGGVDTVEVLLKHGAAIQAKADNGFTPLHTAAQKRDTSIEFILMHSRLYYWNRAPVGFLKVVKVVEMLLKHGADIRAQDDSGVTPLDIALKENRLPIVKLLCPDAGNAWYAWYLERPVTGLGLPVRVSNILGKYGISTYGDLVTKSEEELLAYNLLGQVALDGIKTQLAKAELTLGMTFD